ncbi:hypothetical protein FKM82_025412, partial [Ascaphus truei]
VRAVERYGGTHRWRFRCLCHFPGGTPVALRVGLCSGRHGVRGDRRHYSRGSNGRQWKVGLMDVHLGLCGDDVIGCRFGVILVSLERNWRRLVPLALRSSAGRFLGYRDDGEKQCLQNILFFCADDCVNNQKTHYILHR